MTRFRAFLDWLYLRFVARPTGERLWWHNGRDVFAAVDSLQLRASPHISGPFTSRAEAEVDCAKVVP